MTQDYASEVSDKFADDIAKAYGDEYAIASALVIPHLMQGISWALVTHKQVRDLQINKFDRTDLASKGVWLFPVANGVIILHDFNTLAGIVHQYVSLFTDEILQGAKDFREKSVTRLTKLLAKNDQEIYMGFYCLNDSPTISIKAKTYPAFAVDLNQLCPILEQYGYNFVIDGQVVAPNQVLSMVSTNPDEVLKHFTVAPSSNALLTTIRKA